jgi:hypothetical protein
MPYNFELIRSFGFSTTVVPDHANSSGASWTIQTSGGRGGRACARGSSSGGSFLMFPIVSGSVKYIAFAIKPDIMTQGGGVTFLAGYFLGGQLWSIRCDAAGILTMWNSSNILLFTSSTGGHIQPGVWNHLQIKVTNSTTVGQVEIRKNGASTPIVNTPANLNTNTGTIDAIHLQSSMGSVIDFGDLVVASGDWPGDMAVSYKKPNGVGNSTQWTPSAGSNFQTVDESTKDTSDYNATSTVGNKDTFAMEDVVVPSVIKGVAPVILAEKMDGGLATINAVIRHSGVDYDQSAIGVPFGSPGYVQPNILENNPGTAAPFSHTDWNAIELGYKRAS